MSGGACDHFVLPDRTAPSKPWTYAQSGLVKYWLPLQPEPESPNARTADETKADWIARVGVADPVNRSIAFDVDGVRVTLTRTARETRPSPPSRWYSQVTGNPCLDRSLS